MSYLRHMTAKKIVWICLGLLSIGLKAFLSPEWIEHYYSRGFFKIIRWIIDGIFGWLPFPLLYLFVPLMLWWGIKTFRDFWQWSAPRGKKAVSAFSSVAAFIFGGIFIFLLMWGFNYGRVPLEDSLGISVEPVSKEALWQELQEETTEIIRLRKMIHGVTDSALTADFLPPNLEDHLRTNLVGALQREHLPATGTVRVHYIYPKGIFLRFSSSGLYFPYTGQGQVDGGLHPLQWPYVITHEMGHGYGFGDEGTCNFLAWWACSRSADPAVAYMGRLAYWRTVAANNIAYDRDKYFAFRETLPAGIIADLEAINENLLAYPDIMPKLRYYAYDSYLKAQGINEGIKNYNRVIMLVRGWKERRE